MRWLLITDREGPPLAVMDGEEPVPGEMSTVIYREVLTEVSTITYKKRLVPQQMC